jgi:hypothetical protein
MSGRLHILHHILLPGTIYIPSTTTRLDDLRTSDSVIESSRQYCNTLPYRRAFYGYSTVFRSFSTRMTVGRRVILRYFRAITLYSVLVTGRSTKYRSKRQCRSTCTRTPSSKYTSILVQFGHNSTDCLCVCQALKTAIHNPSPQLLTRLQVLEYGTQPCSVFGG